MIFIKNGQKATLANIIIAITGIIAFSTIIAFFIHGTELFSSLSYFMEYTPLGWAYGFTFLFGHWIIGNYIEKLNWTKNLKRANVISLLMYILYGIVVSIMVPLLYGKVYFSPKT